MLGCGGTLIEGGWSAEDLDDGAADGGDDQKSPQREPAGSCGHRERRACRTGGTYDQSRKRSPRRAVLSARAARKTSANARCPRNSDPAVPSTTCITPSRPMVRRAATAPAVPAASRIREARERWPASRPEGALRSSCVSLWVPLRILATPGRAWHTLSRVWTQPQSRLNRGRREALEHVGQLFGREWGLALEPPGQQREQGAADALRRHLHRDRRR